MIASRPAAYVARKVLVVDDEVSILRSTTSLLEDMGFEVVATNDAREILPMALRERPDIILQDVRMPGLDFDSTVTRIRRQPELSNTQLVIFTAGMDADEIAERVGIARILEKPFAPDDLLAALEEDARIAIASASAPRKRGDSWISDRRCAYAS